MKDTTRYKNIIKQIYDKVENSYKITIDNVSEIEIDIEQLDKAYSDIVSRLV